MNDIEPARKKHPPGEREGPGERDCILKSIACRTRCLEGQIVTVNMDSVDRFEFALATASGWTNDRHEVTCIAQRRRFLPYATVERAGKVFDQDQDAPRWALAKNFLRPGDHQQIRLYMPPTPRPSQMRLRIRSKMATSGTMGSLSSHEIDRRKEEPAKTQFVKQAYPDRVSLVNAQVVGERDFLSLIEYFFQRRL